MNKKAIVAVVLILVAVAIAYLFVSKKPAIAPEVTPLASSEGTPMTSLRDLISKGVPQSCTYGTNNSNGTIYLGGGKIRGDFNTTTSGSNDQVVISHMIIMDNTNYLWTEGSKIGIKMTFDQNATPAPVTSDTPTNSFDADALNNYKCSPWVVDNSFFTLPTNVDFRTFNLPSTAPTSASSSGSNSRSFGL